jgi:transcriptional regulator with XRE-family HTH domain
MTWSCHSSRRKNDRKGEEHMTIGQLVKRHCEENKISHFEFADMVNMTPCSVSRLVRNEWFPAIPYIKNIAKVLGMSYMELITEHFSTFDNDDEVIKV